MRIAVISDIHSNPTALKAVLKDAESKGCGRVICLGDIVGYGYDPNGCIDICREKKIECILGNHDAGLVGSLSLGWFNSFAADAVARQREKVTEDNKEWLRHLPYTAKDKSRQFEIAFSHGTLTMPERFDYIQTTSDAAYELARMHSDGIRVLFVGHTHYAMLYKHYDNMCIDEAYIDLDDEHDYDLSLCDAAIVNVGSCGYPRNQAYSIYGIYDTDTHLFIHRILPFDFDDYIEKMKEANAEIPYWIPTRKKEAEERTIGFR